ncbi:MAG TPA: branched-chain amino acid ABC transporter permease [Solirubrobacteraceae bacterium]
MKEVVQYVIDGISLGALDALLALGVGLIFGVMRLVNFAQGAYIMLAGYVLFFTISASWAVVIPLTLLAGIAIAIITERVAFRPLRGADGSTLMVASFSVAFLIQSIMITIEGSGPKSIPIWSFVSESIKVIGLQIPVLDLISIGVSACLIVGLWLFLTRTRTGLAMRAAAEDFQMLRLLGGRATRVIAVAFALSGLLAAIAGVLLFSQTAVVGPEVGTDAVLIGFVATVIGGLGSVQGAALGGFLLGALTTALQATLPNGLSAYRDAFVFGAVIALLVFRPQGLLGNRADAERVV